MSLPTESNQNEGLSADKVAKIHRDLDVVRNNMTVFSEMLTELNPSGGGNPADLELLQELYKTCKEMQSRVGQLLCTPTTDELTVYMLQINDDLNDLFDRYDRKTATYTTKPSSEMPLIDLGDEGATPSLISDLRAMNLTQPNQPQPQPPAQKKDDSDFDQFVQSRNPSSNKDTNSSGQRQLHEDEIIHGHRETDFEEMEAWLRANPGAADASMTSMPSIPHPQFDSYLAGRAAGSRPGQDKPSS